MYVFDACRLVSQDGVSCIESEIVMSCIVGFSMLYVGVLWGIITYQNKHDNGKITRLSNMGINGATALLVRSSLLETPPMVGWKILGCISVICLQ